MKPQIFKQPNWNKTEKLYAMTVLEPARMAQEIWAWRFEPVKLRLADRTYYSPDFLVVKENCFEFHEIKGFMRDDAAVKFKTAQEVLPWIKFRLFFYDRKRGFYEKKY